MPYICLKPINNFLILNKINIILLLFFAFSSLYALSDDKNQALHVTADKVMINYAQGITNLEGKAIVTQGSTILSANKIIIYTDKHQKLIKLIAYGNESEQANYETLPQQKKMTFRASADKITYLSEEECAKFEGNAHATDGQNEFSGPQFDYFTSEEKIITEKSLNQRPSIIIYPGKK